MKPEAIESLKSKGFVLQPDGSWSKVRGAGAACCRTDTEGMTSVKPAPVLKRVRQSSRPLLNKLEQSFWNERLEIRYPKAKPQALKFRLGNGVTYTPDFIDLSVQPVKAWECKGQYSWDDAMVKLKLAATIWPEVRWILVWKQDGQWQEQEILP